MSAAQRLGEKVIAVVGVGLEDMWHTARYLDPVLPELGYFRRIVGQQPDPFDSELAQHRRRGPEIALVTAEAQMMVGFHRVETVVLEQVGAQLVGQADPTPLLRQVEQDPAAL